MTPQTNSASNHGSRDKPSNQAQAKLDHDLKDVFRESVKMWRRIPTHPYFPNRVGDSAKKSNSELSSSPIQNPKAARLKLEAQVTYGLCFGCLNTHWKDNSEIFPTDPEPYSDSSCGSLCRRNNSWVVLSPSQIGV